MGGLCSLGRSPGSAPGSLIRPTCHSPQASSSSLSPELRDANKVSWLVFWTAGPSPPSTVPRSLAGGRSPPIHRRRLESPRRPLHPTGDEGAEQQARDRRHWGPGPNRACHTVLLKLMWPDCLGQPRQPRLSPRPGTHQEAVKCLPAGCLCCHQRMVNGQASSIESKCSSSQGCGWPW